MSKRQYTRRTPEERIADLEAEIAKQKDKIRERKAKREAVSPVVKEIPKLAKRLQQFAQLATDHGRYDIANTTSMFLAGLHRIHEEERKPSRAELEALESEAAEFEEAI